MTYDASIGLFVLKVAFCASVCKGCTFDGTIYFLIRNLIFSQFCKMNKLIFALACALAVTGVMAADTCYQDVSMDCGQASNSLALPRCNAVYGNYGRHGNVATELQAYANLHLERSYHHCGYGILPNPEIAQYLEEEFVEKHAETIRNLAGHTADLKKFILANNGQDLSLALYLFDEYLQKVA
ncbi:unnamed protein product, partial [Iphiclides podalirius]